ncbi:DNA-binding LacI/PurR family transcriptional regulator [Actinopolyspora biskrensis]|uniref:DNA-binding LacI/PurR family transcriptional regulator n=1 Tax=Actinopolyspora biskrensis TaxID=1470178 RepID=A0A852YZD8_9ACTN|nr:DNA-binding LacI/PurR family transcriptional regulator [Actinopolyspora biskrensis]
MNSATRRTASPALREGTSRIVVLNVDTSFEGNYSRSFTRGLDEELAEHEHELMVRHCTPTARSTRQVLDAITPRAVLRLGEAYLTGDALGDQGGGWRDGLAAHTSMQLRHLAERGHTRIAMALPDPESPLSGVRLRFAREAARTLGLPPLRWFAVPRPRSAGTVAVRDFLDTSPPPSAIAAFDDDIALRVVTGLHDLGYRVPDDVAVIGFDDTEYGELVTPALTTVHIDAESHGRLAARTVLELDTTGLDAVPGRVIVRESA